MLEMGGDPQWVDEDQRVLYHAALAGGANHLMHPGQRVGRPAAPLRRRRARSGCSAPLLGAALDNALRAGDAALTGPVARGDAGTVAAHLRRARARCRRTPPAPTSRWPGSPPTGRWPPACCDPTRPRPCSTCSPKERRPMTTRLVHTRAELRGAARQPAGRGRGRDDDGRPARRAPRADPRRPPPLRGHRRHRLPQPAAVRAGRGPRRATPRRSRPTSSCARPRTSTWSSPRRSRRSTRWATSRRCGSRPGRWATSSRAPRGPGTSTAC